MYVLSLSCYVCVFFFFNCLLPHFFCLLYIDACLFSCLVLSSYFVSFFVFCVDFSLVHCLLCFFFFLLLLLFSFVTLPH